MTEYEKGVEHHKQNKKVTGIHGTFTGEFHKGYVFQERISRCGYADLHWNKNNKVKSY
jgi:hypothetical protein